MGGIESKNCRGRTVNLMPDLRRVNLLTRVNLKRASGRKTNKFKHKGRQVQGLFRKKGRKTEKGKCMGPTT